MMTSSKWLKMLVVNNRMELCWPLHLQLILTFLTWEFWQLKKYVNTFWQLLILALKVLYFQIISNITMCFFSLLDTQTLENDGSSLACSPLTSSSWGCLVTLEDTPILSPRTATGHGMGELVKVGLDPSCTLMVDAEDCRYPEYSTFTESVARLRSLAP